MSVGLSIISLILPCVMFVYLVLRSPIGPLEGEEDVRIIVGIQ
jgi:hypothetical protein